MADISRERIAELTKLASAFRCTLERGELLALLSMASRCVAAEREARVRENLLTVGRLATRGVPLEHASRCIYLLRDDYETWEREESRKEAAEALAEEGNPRE